MATARRKRLFRKGIAPIGTKNSVNLSFTTPENFEQESLEVFLSGDAMDKVTDFVVTGPNSFNIVTFPEDPVRLNTPPMQYESFFVNYEVAGP